MGISVYTKIGVVVLALALSAGFYVFVGHIEEPVVVHNALETDGLKAVESQLTQIDSDNDGLHDWEETLWGTNPRNPDTDGDGTSDGDEVTQNRHPNIPAPNDTMNARGEVAGQEVVVDNSNVTESAAKDFFGQYITLKQQGVPMTEETQTELAASIIESVPQMDAEKRYTLRDIKIKSDSSSAALRLYANRLGDILSRNTPAVKDHELNIFSRALELESETELAKLDPFVEGYRNVEQEFLGVEVPEAVATLHVAFLNQIADMHMVLTQMRNVFTDPMQTLSIMSEYDGYVTDLASSMRALAQYFRTHDVSFQQNDAGYFFTQI